MPPVAWPPNTVQAAFESTNNQGVTAQNVFHIKTANAISPADLQTLANDLFTYWTTAAEGSLGIFYRTSGVSAASCTCVDLTGSSGEATSTHAAVPGAASGVTMAPNVAGVVSWHIGRRYRGGHPRTYLFGLSDSILPGDGSRVMGATFASNLANAAGQLLTAVNALSLPAAGGCTLGSVQHSTVKTPITSPVFWPYLSAAVDLRLGSQRRRLGKPAGV